MRYDQDPTGFHLADFFRSKVCQFLPSFFYSRTVDYLTRTSFMMRPETFQSCT
jgi:hypothetical protein